MPTRSRDLTSANWRKSSRTGGGNDAQCVELACLVAGGAVRDSKENGTGPVVVVGAGAFWSFLRQARSGGLDG
ncbi:DUF397 domain-containing protein [Alloactinosynnema sp. L-07]|uniref:DUF397 domain-containing protein n=1 Tax=Alloactinosynnema sp. L-07 TaxID=1653480 RepID=UPI0009ECCF4E|nr:DUF397 domain-containing protein [Alloactinosynnema sp. L-07]